jgi:enoyl-CoA hydratase/carnithine racemase
MIPTQTLFSNRVKLTEILYINRPKTLNSINTEICKIMLAKLDDLNKFPTQTSCFMLKGVGGKAFCAGGDVKSVVTDLASQPSSSNKERSFFSTEYKMNYELSKCKVPQISIWDGVVMGGGVGISIFGKYRIATEKTLFAMPETAIGLFPDVGSSFWLAKLNRGVGQYIGLTGCRLKYQDLVTLGIATHYIPSEKLDLFETSVVDEMISDSSEDNSSILEDILNRYANVSNIDHPISKLSFDINRVFNDSENVEEIFEKLELYNGENSDWAASTLTALKKASPTSLKLTFQQIKTAQQKNLDLKECLKMVYLLYSFNFYSQFNMI